MKWVAGLIVLGGGAAAVFMWWNAQKASAVQADTNTPEPAPIVIKAGEAPPDTQGQIGVKGSNVDATPVQDLKSRSKRSKARSNGSSRPSGSSSAPKKGSDKKRLELKGGDDQL